ncbi:MAG: amidohydrolase [Bacteroidetes bacterium]|nr:amidohydrolase [Bacteroidota bacterium]
MKEYYLPTDFIKAPKYDAHTHYHTFNDVCVRKAKKANMNLLSINTNFDILPIDAQLEISQVLHKRHPETFNFLGTFNAVTFASETFAEDAIEHITKCMTAGARGIKIWKNIGMTLKNEAGTYVMADNPVFAPIFAFLEKKKIPLLAHLGEPRNCWLPLESMTTDSDRRYFSKNPNYHMYLHSDIPSYEQQIEARDRILERYPELIFVGAHLGSMDWSFEEIAKRFDRFPNFYVDLSGRFDHIVEQTLRNRNLVIDFFETYRNRIVYGLDYFVAEQYRWGWTNLVYKCFPSIYMSLLFEYLCRKIKKHWLFFATDTVIKTGNISNNPELPTQITGLKLPKNVVDCIFYKNAKSIYSVS